MLTQAIPRQPNSALTLREIPRALRVAGNYGARLNAMLLTVLRERLKHRNRDGSDYLPRVVDSLIVPLQGEPYYHVMVIDSQALWHFDLDDFLRQETLDAMTGTIKKPVRAFNYPKDGGPFRGGIVYVVKLQDLPKVEETRLPKVARLDLGTRPESKDKSLVPVGVSSFDCRSGCGDVWLPLAEVGHALIVGTTGSGKSTWLHSALAALLTTNAPEHLRVALVDPKQSELAPWASAPHVFGEIAFDSDQAAVLLGKIVDEINTRGNAFAAAGCRDIAGYNRRTDKPLPYILVVIDECLDLVLSAGQKSSVANFLRTIAVRGRSAGAILWAATQHASAVKGLPRVVNVNLGTRLVFRVADADAALRSGCPGAQSIPRTIPGRMLAKLNAEPVAMQGYFLSEEELLAIARGVDGDAARSARQASLTERERQIAIVAMTNRGEFNIGDIARAVGESTKDITALAKEWEERGWLTPVQRSGKGNKPRQVTDILVELVQAQAQ